MLIVHDLGLGNGFSDKILKGQATKEKNRKIGLQT